MVELLPCLIAVAGMLLWMAYLGLVAGDPLAFVHAEAGWGRHPSNPLSTLGNALRDLSPSRHRLEEGWQGVWALVGLLVSAWLAWQRRWVESGFLAVTVLLALSSGSDASLSRFVGASPVFLLAGADLIDRCPRAGARLGWLAGCAVLQCWFTARWVEGWHWLV